jgi:hypothetical protein
MLSRGGAQMPARNLVDPAGAKAHDVLLVEDDDPG